LSWLRPFRAALLTARGRASEAAALYRDTRRRSPADHPALHDEAEAATEYDAARDRGLGVCFDAVCTIGDTTYATVLWPTDALDAELIM